MTWAGMSRSQPRRRLSRAIGPAERVRAARGLSGYLVPVIIWINGAFGAGKTTLAGELHRRLPDAVVYNPSRASRQGAGQGRPRCRAETEARRSTWHAGLSAWPAGQLQGCEPAC